MKKIKLNDAAKEIYLGLNIKNYNDKNFASIVNIENKEKIFLNLINISNIDNNGFFEGEFKKIKIVSEREIAKYRVKEGDVILNSRGTSLKAAIVDEHRSGYVLTSNMIGITLNHEVITPEVFEFYIRSEMGFYELMKLSASSKNNIKLTKETMGDLNIPLYKKNDLQKITEIISEFRMIKKTASNISNDLEKISSYIIKIMGEYDK